jgi:hypothetical protein
MNLKLATNHCSGSIHCPLPHRARAWGHGHPPRQFRLPLSGMVHGFMELLQWMPTHPKWLTPCWRRQQRLRTWGASRAGSRSRPPCTYGPHSSSRMYTQPMSRLSLPHIFRHLLVSNCLQASYATVASMRTGASLYMTNCVRARLDPTWLPLHSVPHSTSASVSSQLHSTGSQTLIMIQRRR